MLQYIVKRLIYAVPVALAVSVICFSLVQIAPGDPLAVVLPADASQEIIDQTKARYGLDKPLVTQYFLWLGNALTGDFGISIATGRSVSAEIASAIGYSLGLAIFATLIALVVGLTFGLVAGYNIGKPIDKIASAVAISGVSVPSYWLGVVLVVIFSVHLGWLPAMGAGINEDAGLSERLSFMVLPSIALAAMPAGIVTRSVRALVADVLTKEFVNALRAKGLSEFQIFIHVTRNAAPTALTVIGVQLGYLMAGSILVETVFSWPGTGLLLNNAILTRDIPVLQGTTLVLALVFVLLNLVVDITQPLLDPRIKRT
ncbi:ABC transporter permease [Sedimentitalea sp. JM2-8]|uniref:ABC transporter permease n=1 Tax=Sedimentitalea xiamensis TaxID=3050037 RepID=A0ABT7FIM4_9RHOB|nr:ABC transporter permease [Sedimentitalea xiamensis]MDK3074987.1 ABC transporter permease [Sedimentitalea xiamensis]